VEGSAAKNLFGAFALDYGAPERGPTEAPFDAFTMAVRVGGGATVSAASIRGRLASRRLGGLDPLAHQLIVAQDYGYREAPGFLFGEQSVIGGLASRVELRPGVSLSTTASAAPSCWGLSTRQRSSSPIARSTRSWHDRFRIGGVDGSRHAGARCGGGGVVDAYGDPRAGHPPAVAGTREGPGSHRRRHPRAGEGERVARDSRVDGRSIKRDAYPELRAGLAWRFGY